MKEAYPESRIRIIEDRKSLQDLLGVLSRYEWIALDVETTLYDHRLCWVQIGVPGRTWLIDALRIQRLSVLKSILSTARPVKLIHYAPFERKVFRAIGIEIESVIDTCTLSRKVRGRKIGRHNLQEVCARELGVYMDKGEQASDWTRRPITSSQRRYAALDAEVLLLIYEALTAT